MIKSILVIVKYDVTGGGGTTTPERTDNIILETNIIICNGQSR